MVKFLSGGQFSGERVSVCTYWRSDVATNTDEDAAALTGTGVDPDVAVQDPTAPSNQCIANAFFRKDDITCFNEGRCNGAGKCLPCSKYKYGGMRLGITHSPPLEFLRQFNKGLTEIEVKSPNLAAFPPSTVNQRERDQVPLHILYKNIMAQISKCCHWSAGDGLPSRFYLAKIISGPDTITFQDETSVVLAGGGPQANATGIVSSDNYVANINTSTLTGILVKNAAFPDEVGTFFPVGLTVVAGFEDQPSFYLEPRTGLPKPGDGVIFGSEGDTNLPLVRMKQAATASTQTMIDTVNATIAVCDDLTLELSRQTDFFANAQATEITAIVSAAQAKLTDITTRKNTACTAATSAQTAGTAANGLIGSIVGSTDVDAAAVLSQQLTDKLVELADLAEVASNAGTGRTASANAARQAGTLRRLARNVEFSAFKSFSKCEFFYDDNNVAAQWNNPVDGTLPCNGIRTDCAFYTGEAWQFATDEKLDVGNRITAEALQEIRFRSDDWDRYVNPEVEFRNRFATPFIWAFDRYVDAFGAPDLEDLILYRPKVLFLKDEASPSLPEDNYQTIQMQKVEIDDFDTFSVSKSAFRTQPGSDTLDRVGPPQFPTKVLAPNVPTANRLKITHPNPDDLPFVYRTWSPDKNKITLFGYATPNSTVYLVNDTALRNRQRYHTYLGTSNLVDSLPTGLPGAPSFVGITSTTLRPIFDALEDEKRLSTSAAPLGFHVVNTDRTGFWQSIQEIDLVHNDTNSIYAFVLVNDFQLLFDATQIDYRFVHALPRQQTFAGKDFSIDSSGDGGGNQFGAASGDITKGGRITATFQQVVGREPVGFSYGYLGWRFKDRNLKLGILNADNDLQGDVQISDDAPTNLVTEAGPSAFITGTAYNVVQYQKNNVTIPNWYLINDCGFIMIEIPDLTANRVLPLPNQQGAVSPLTGVLLNGGGSGAIEAQFGILEATITLRGEETKTLVQEYRDADGFGLPANFVVLGPSPFADQAFGRPVPGRDLITINYTYLKAQTSKEDGTADAPLGDGEVGEVINSNFFGDNLRGHTTRIQFTEDGSLVAGTNTGSVEDAAQAIRDDQQDYVWVFSDLDGRPIGRKVSRMMIMYYNLACINVEIFYRWASACTTYGLFPDVFLQVGLNDGTLVTAPKGTIDPADLTVGQRVANLLGEFTCPRIPNCGDHEFLSLGPLRAEFEVIVEAQDTNRDGTPALNLDGSPKLGLKAAFPSAGGPVVGQVQSVQRVGSQWLKRRGPLWYPFTACERPRYDFKTNGPFHTDSTELVNTEVSPAGISVGSQVLQDNQVSAAQGTFGLLPRADFEAYHAIDRVVPKILDMHPSLRVCTSAYTHGNQVLTGRNASFVGAARRRGEIDLFWYEGLDWGPPLFGNFGRAKLVFEVADKRGDFLAGGGGQSVGFRWMPLFPEREDLGANISLFSEELEPQHYRFVQVSNPIASMGEVVSPVLRFTHKELIQNKVAGGIEYPYIPYYPTFLPDLFLGSNPVTRDTQGKGFVSGPISTMWAWREQEKNIKRGQNESDVLVGIQLQSPDYFIDSRRLEVRLRPAEGTYPLTFVPPTYDEESGDVLTNATLTFAQGPPREIVIDFANKTLQVAEQADTVYDSSLTIGDVPFPCEPNAPTDNPLLSTKCSCIDNANDPALDGPPAVLPATFLHLDSVAPEGFVGLYENVTLNTPFAIPLERTQDDDPCCQCVYYIRGIFFRLDLEFLPTSELIDPAFDSRSPFKYTWSRVPHGLIQNEGTDGVFATNENLIDNYISHTLGAVFLNRFLPELTTLSIGLDAAAIFPSAAVALQARADGTPIGVVGVPSSELHGGTEATDNESFGEDEAITLDFTFETYVKVKRVVVTFFAGTGWQVPSFKLGIIDPVFRGIGAADPSIRTVRYIGESTVTANGTNVPFSAFLDADALRVGLPGKVGAKFTVTLEPSYSDMSFWNQFGMEFHLDFGSRDGTNSLGIAGIELSVESFGLDSEIAEEIFVPERKYYISTGAVGGDVNPEEVLEEADSATAYWRQTETGSKRGANKFRAYAFGNKIEDNQAPLRGDPKALEQLQVEEYNAARDLMTSPYAYDFITFVPFDEASAIQFHGGTVPDGNLKMSLEVSPVDEVLLEGRKKRLYGQIPADRNVWHAPGHAWTFRFVENYTFCCNPCPRAMVIDYNYAHLHDGLAVVETARFWDELPSGFTRLIRSTEMSPDPSFGQSQESGVGITGGTSGQAIVLNAADIRFLPPNILNSGGLGTDNDGNPVYVPQGGE